MLNSAQSRHHNVGAQFGVKQGEWACCTEPCVWRLDSLADSDNLPPPGVIAQEIVEDLQAALEQFKLIAEELSATDTAEQVA